MKKIIIYNKLGIPAEDLDIPGVEKSIYYENEEFYFKAMDTLWLNTVREKTYNVVINMSTPNYDITSLLYKFDNITFFLIYSKIEYIKEYEHTTIDKINYDKALNILNKKFPKLENKIKIAKLLTEGKKKFTDLKLGKIEYNLGF